MSEAYKGSCLCGSIRFEADQFRPLNGHCHCRMCRKFHGAAHSTYAEVAAEDFRWTAGEEWLKDYVADNGTTRQFCASCGSSLTFRAAGVTDGSVEIALGCFDDDVPIRPDAHIFVDFAANWVTPADELPQYAEGRDSKQLK